MQETSNGQDTDAAALRRAASRIFGAAVLACLVLFIAIGLVATIDFAYELAGLLFAGVVTIVALSLYQWQRIAEARLRGLITQMADVERARGEAQLAQSENERMLAAMTHEIRTPLNGVVGMADLLLDTGLSPEQRNYAASAAASGRTLLSLIDEILDTAKNRAATSSDTHCRIRPAVEGVTELLAARAHAKGIEMSCFVDAALPAEVALRETHLRQILFNLAGNAIKFTEKGGVAIDVMRSDTGIDITVTDTGIGMSRSETEEIFNDFRQANEGVAQRFGGTGLGLGITQRLVKALNGEVTVHSTPGEGTTFTARIPLPLPPPQEPQRPLLGHRIELALTCPITLRHLQMALHAMGAETHKLETSRGLRFWLKSPDANASLIVDAGHAVLLRHWLKSHRNAQHPAPVIWTLVTPEERRTYPELLREPFAGYLLRPLRGGSLAKLLNDGSRRIDEAVKALRAVPKPQSQALRILLADDTPVNLLLTRTMLEKLGHRVTTAVNGREALDISAKRDDFDLLMLDVEMPVMDGCETATAVRARERDAKLGRMPILALTAHVRQQDLDRCLASGMDGHMSKPFDQHDLLEALSRLGLSRAA